jgi:hypothetical protein
MTDWQFALTVVHSLICIGIIVMAMELMRRRRNGGCPASDPLLWVYYIGAVGAFLYLVEPIDGANPTIADVVFESAACLYLWLKLRDSTSLLIVRSR